MPSARRPGASPAPGLVVSGLVMLDDKENVMAGLRGLKGWKHRNQEKKPAEEPAAAAAAPLSNNRSTTPPQPGGAALELFSPSKPAGGDEHSWCEREDGTQHGPSIRLWPDGTLLRRRRRC